jgi:hypothetical protein
VSSGNSLVGCGLVGSLLDSTRHPFRFADTWEADRACPLSDGMKGEGIRKREPSVGSLCLPCGLRCAKEEVAMHKAEGEMKKAAKLLWYERRQFSWAASIVNGPKPAPGIGPKCAFDGAVEVFLLHTRTLRDFFLRSRPLSKNAETDILAEDFFDTPGQWTKPTCIYLTEPRTKERLDRALAHVTYDRIDYARTGKNWRTSLIAAELDGAWSAFIGALPTDRRAWFESA